MQAQEVHDPKGRVFPGERAGMNRGVHHWLGEWERERERERESERARVHFFVPLGLKPGAWVWDDQVLFEKNQSTSQTFTSFIWVYPLVRLTGLYGPAPSPVPPTFQYWKGEGGSVNPFGRAMLCFPGVWSCSFLVKQTGFCSPVCSAQCLVPFAPRF